MLDPQSPTHIETLKKTHAFVIAFTAARGRDVISAVQMPDVRYEHLKKLGITFDRPESLALSYHPDPDRRTWAVFENGILYSDHRDKGDILGEFLDRVGWKVSHIVLVDDNPWNLLSVQTAAARRKIPFTGFVYQQQKPLRPSDEVDALLTQAFNTLGLGGWGD